MKSRKTALLLAIFLGWSGAHRFYVGRILSGIIWLFTNGLFGIGWIIDIICILSGSFQDAQGNRLLRKSDAIQSPLLKNQPAQQDKKHYTSPAQKGAEGEQLISDILKQFINSESEYKVLQNLYIPTGSDGNTAEIDVVILTDRGLFVIESKNFSGCIYGREQDLYWTQTLPNGCVNQFYNPVKQNDTHLAALDQYLLTNYPMYSLVVFSNRCELKNVPTTLSVPIIQLKDLGKTVADILYNEPYSYDAEIINSIYEKLLATTNASSEIKARHISYTKKCQ